MIMTLITTKTEYAVAWLEAPGEVIYVTYGELEDGEVPEEGTSERLGHFLEEGETYPTTEEELKKVLFSIVS